MSARTFAVLIGLVYLVAGMVGFLPTMLEPPPANAPPLSVKAYYGYLLGLFPVNFMHNLVHLAIGAWGVASSRRAQAARGFCRALAVIYGALALLGLMPETYTLFGLVPLHGYDVWLHAGTAFLAAIFGWLIPDRSARKSAAAPSP